MIFNTDECQVVMIDFSAKSLQRLPQKNSLVGCAKELARISKILNVPVWGAEHASALNGPMQEEIRSCCQKVMPKLHFDACEEGLSEILRGSSKTTIQGNARSLPKHLQKKEILNERSTILIAGFETHISVLQTALGLIDLEFDVCLVIDACASVNALNHDAALDRLAGAGVEIVTLEMVACEWVSAQDHPSYAEIMKHWPL